MKAIERKKQSEIAQLCPTLCDPMDCSPSSNEFFRQEYWSGLPFPSPGDLPDPGIERGSPALQADAFRLRHHGNPLESHNYLLNKYHFLILNLKVIYLHSSGQEKVFVFQIPPMTFGNIYWHKMNCLQLWNKCSFLWIFDFLFRLQIPRGKEKERIHLFRLTLLKLRVPTHTL